MVLKSCRECSKQVSTEAITCPGCGVPNPIKKNLKNISTPVELKSSIDSPGIGTDTIKSLGVKTTNTSLGIETVGGIFTEIIKKGTIIPEKKSQVFSTSENNQCSISIRILRGNSQKAIENELIEVFEINNIPPAPRGVPQIEVTFAIDENANVYIRSKDLGTSKKIEKQIGKIKTQEVIKNYKDKENKSNILYTKLSNFWSGNNGLAFSFWGIFIFGNICLNILTLLLISNETIVLLIYIASIIWNILAVIGVFNSANIYKAKKIKINESYVWATVAKVATILLVLSALGNSIKYFK
jgi:hypothetical protein